MAVIVEGITVIVRCYSIDRKYRGGWERFVAEAPPVPRCSDDELAAFRFMAPADVQAYVESLERRGLEYVVNKKAEDIVVVDQRTGMCAPCDWAIFGTTSWNNDPSKPVAFCSAFPSRIETLSLPEGWVFERSLSASHRFVETNNVPASLKLIRSDRNLDVYFDEETGREYYIARHLTT